MDLKVATWKYGKDWVYSVTYDEALSELAQFVIPAHEELGIPGHVEVVAGHIGTVRQIGQSSYNGFHHMSAEELRGLIARGWGVGCHSWSHEGVMADPERELLRARETLTEAIGKPVTIYCSPGDNSNLTEDIQAKLPGYGYLAGMSITDDINRPDTEDLLWINRSPLHERYGGVFDSRYDAYHRIRQAQEEHGWIVDYLHCPLEQAVHECKDCSAAHHRQRLEAVVGEGGDRCWYANPDDVVDYRYMRRGAGIEKQAEGAYLVRLDVPEHVQCRELTFELGTHLTPEAVDVAVDGARALTSPGPAGRLIFTARVCNGSEIRMST